jgi:3-oxoacyl-[acyl-carrier protein] reductase
MTYILIAASSDIGLETAKILKNQDKNIYITARNAEVLEELKSQLNCSGEVLDATDFNATEQVFKNAIETYGDIQGVACFAGSLSLKPVHLVGFDEYLNTIHASLTTAFSTVRASGKFIKNGGSVVLISSAAAMQGLANHEAIAAAKGGVISLAKSAAATYAGQNIRFNVIAPGLTETKLTSKITTNETNLKFSKAMHALGRIASAQEVANAVAFFLSPENSFITGQVLAVDGGLSNLQPKQKA